jgi:hypothetical protein
MTEKADQTGFVQPIALDEVPKDPLMEYLLKALESGRRIATIGMVLEMPEYTWVGTESALRHIIQDASANGLDKFNAIIRLGPHKNRHRVLLDLTAFDAWTDSHRKPPLFPQWLKDEQADKK